MKNVKYEIGAPHRILALILGVVFSYWGIGLIYFGGINPTPELFFGQNMMGVVAGGVTLLVTFIIVIPGIYNCKLRWKVDDEILRYTDYGGIVNRIKLFYMPKRNEAYNMILKLDKVATIRLGWQNVPKFPYGLISHPIIFHIMMKDGSEVEIESLVTKDSKKYCQAVRFLGSKGIEIIDKHGLLKVIDSPHRSVAQYIDEIEAEYYAKN